MSQRCRESSRGEHASHAERDLGLRGQLEPDTVLGDGAARLQGTQAVRRGWSAVTCEVVDTADPVTQAVHQLQPIAIRAGGCAGPT
jgi:hypothetical protein